MRNHKTYKPDIDKTIERMEAFWQKEIIDRCCIAVPVSDGGGYNPVEPIPDGEDKQRYYFDPDYIVKRYESKFSKTYFAGDALPTILPYFGSGAHSLYLGGSYECHKETIWIEPFIKDMENVKLRFDENNSEFLCHNEIIKKWWSCRKIDFLLPLQIIAV